MCSISQLLLLLAKVIISIQEFLKLGSYMIYMNGPMLNSIKEGKMSFCNKI